MQEHTKKTKITASGAHPYFQWNDKLAYHFFRRELAGQPVYLYVTDEILTSVGAPFGEGPSQFLDVMRAGPPGLEKLGLCQRAYHLYDGWRERHQRYFPPYIGYLGLFVLAAGLEGDFARHAYYPRLWNLLREPEKRHTPPSFDRMLELWDDLERWSNQDRHGELGVFSVQVAGSWIHVGLPIAQTILTAHERAKLPSIFAHSHLDPVSQPSDAELARLVRRHGIDHLRPRTANLLLKPADDAELRVYEVLLGTIRMELANWEGVVEEAVAASTTSLKRVYGNLSLYLHHLDGISGTVQAGFCCRANRDLPEGDLLVKASNSDETFSCVEILPRWSSQLLRTDGLPLDASEYDWGQDLELVEERFGWHFRFGGNPIRIFISGEGQGLPGLVEVHQLYPNVPFWLAVQQAHQKPVRQWGECQCTEFRELKINNGLPPLWSLFHSRGATSDEGIRDTYPLLSFSEAISLSLQGGLHSSRGNTYFDFGLPVIKVTGGNGKEKVFCNGVEIASDAETGNYTLPDGLRSGMEAHIKVCREGDDGFIELKRRTIFLQNDFEWRREDTPRFFDKFGKCDSTLEDAVSIAYASTNGAASESLALAFPWHIFDAEQTLFIGSRPGQIVSWPNDGLPLDWTPIWAVPIRREHGQAIFCGTSYSNPEIQHGTNDRKKLRLWTEVLYHWRRRVDPPNHPHLRRLWSQYQEAARRAKV